MKIHMNWAFHPVDSNNERISDDNEYYKIPISNEGNEREITNRINESGFDAALYNLLNELHYVVGYQNIVEQNDEFKEEVERKLINLNNFDKYHTNLMYLKKVLFCELNERMVISDYRYEIWDIVKWYYHTNNYQEIIDFVYQELVRLLGHYHMLNRNSHKIISSLVHISDFYHEGDFSERKFFNSILKASFILKDKSLDIELQILGSSMLILFYKYLCYDIQDIRFDSLDHFIDDFNGFTIEEQNETQRNLLMCYLGTGLKQSEFNSRINTFADILRKHNETSGIYVKGRRCFATMNYKGNKYYTLSGSKEYEDQLTTKYYKIFNSLSNVNYKRIQLNDNTRYYYCRKEYISFGDLEKYINLTLHKESETNQLFSCCESKLLSHLYSENGSASFQMYIKYKPCEMCERALQVYDNQYLSLNNAIYFPYSSKSKKKKDIKEFDKLAKKIRDTVNS